MDGISKLCHSLLSSTFSVYILYLSIVLNNDTTLEIMIPKIWFSIMFECLTLLFSAIRLMIWSNRLTFIPCRFMIYLTVINVFSFPFNDFVQPFNVFSFPFNAVSVLQPFNVSFNPFLDFAKPFTVSATLLNGEPNRLQPFTVLLKPFTIRLFWPLKDKALVVVFPFQVRSFSYMDNFRNSFVFSA